VLVFTSDFHWKEEKKRGEMRLVGLHQGGKETTTSEERKKLQGKTIYGGGRLSDDDGGRCTEEMVQESPRLKSGEKIFRGTLDSGRAAGTKNKRNAEKDRLKSDSKGPVHGR